MILCRICGQGFRFLPTHLRHAHQMTAADYRAQFDIPAGEPLASDGYRAAHVEKMRRMQADGRITYDHLPEAVAAARDAERPAKRGADREAHLERMQAVRPWEANQLPPGAKRTDGRDADRAREYQRAYRQKRSKPSNDR
ncbi:MucR family transcriptional regulator [Methylobacterium tarhaniae]|uniref:MucR family transcriptional regulator n=1 Tax=Methylobacterium tarhaniae TaxID=1187852 RepID=UPI00069E49E2|nr:MucR family transcriptional regulator [Methylobacterium tarhaniae]